MDIAAHDVRVPAFDNADFSSPITTGSVTANEGVYAETVSAFSAITARYVKWDVTSAADPSPQYVGAAEMVFHPSCDCYTGAGYFSWAQCGKPDSGYFHLRPYGRSIMKEE